MLVSVAIRLTAITPYDSLNEILVAYFPLGFGLFDIALVDKVSHDLPPASRRHE